MTNREAIKIINQYDMNFHWNDGEPIPAEQLAEAFDLAISALEKQEQDRWIPVTERTPETTDPVNVTWANNDPVSYYEDIRGKRFTATACYHRDKWWWYSAVCQDLLDEYGKSCMDDDIDEAIEILAWRPLPEPYTEDEA